MRKVDFLVIGAGVMGINLARFLKKRFADSSVCLMDKEARPGLHASGRNSGVLHAGFYYTADSMKAKFCREGNRLLTDYCMDKGLPINRCGKLVVASNEQELAGLEELFRRARANGVEIVEMDEQQARAIEPRVITVGKALYSPTTATVSPQAVVDALVADAVQEGVELCCDSAFVSCRGSRVETSRGPIEAGYVVNAAGLYADRIALDYGFSKDFRILPFKGLYLYSDEKSEPLKTNIYPVPNLKQPFLGVHFTVDVNGRTKIGPTAIPAFWREHYGGMENFDLQEMVEIVSRDIGLFVRNEFDFRRVAVEELKKYSRGTMVRLAGHMVRGVENDGYAHWGRPGIRAQLVDIRKRRLEMDFRFEGDDRSFHVLNAVSPAFTCSIPFSEYLVERIANLLGERNIAAPGRVG